MITFTCIHCRLVWSEDRSEGDSPVHHCAFLCPRCKQIGEMDDKKTMKS